MNTIKLYGADWCPDCRRAKAFLKENNIDFNFVDVDLDKEATARVEEINNGKRIIPTLIIHERSYTNPDNIVLSSVLGVNDVNDLVFVKINPNSPVITYMSSFQKGLMRLNGQDPFILYNSSSSRTI